MMHVLYLTNAFPFPLTSGLLRHYFLIRELSSRHRITLFCSVGDTFQPEHAAALEPFTTRIQTFEDWEEKGPVRLMLHQLAGLRPMQDACGGLGQAVRELYQRDPFQVVVTTKQCAGAVAPDLPVPLVADLCDASSMRIRRSFRHASLPQLPRRLGSYLRMRSLEASTLSRSSHCLFISPRDREALLGTRREGTSIVPNGVDTDYWNRSAPALGVDRIVFTGAMDYPPNVDAALRLMGPIFNRVKRQRTSVQLYIVGRDPVPEILQAASTRDGRHVTGFVDDVRPYLDRASVFCAPLRFGAGMQNKVLEALSMGVPCVVSSLAAEGLRTEAGEWPPLTIADGEEQAAREILGRLEQASSGQAPPDCSGRAFVQQHFQWQLSGARLSRILEDLSKHHVPGRTARP